MVKAMDKILKPATYSATRYNSTQSKETSYAWRYFSRCYIKESKVIKLMVIES